MLQKRSKSESHDGLSLLTYQGRMGTKHESLADMQYQHQPYDGVSICCRALPE